MEVEANTSGQTQAKTKFCKHCGKVTVHRETR